MDFTTLGTRADRIDVRLSYKIVELFSEGLYASPNKALEELVANSFDAGATWVQLIMPADLAAQGASIAVIDNGEGMNVAGLKQHWIIGSSNKRALKSLPKNRQQIGKFGIGKLATYVLAGRLTHIAKADGKYFSATMNYESIQQTGKQITPERSIKIPVRILTETQAKQALTVWTDTPASKKTKLPLFGKGAPPSWTVAIMSSLKPKVRELKLGTLNWVLRTALPLRPDFAIWLDGEKLEPSKQGKGLIKKWTLGSDMVELPRPAPKQIEISIDQRLPSSHEKHFGLRVPGLGRVSGFAEAYKDLLTGKSEQLGRSNGFFVYVYGRLVNVVDGHFGISPDELRHGTFGRFRCVINIDGLDAELRSNREAISEGPLLSTAQNLLRGIFNAARAAIEKHDEDEDPATRLGRRVAGSPASLARRPIIELARAVARGQRKSRYLVVPIHATEGAREAFFADLEKRAASEQFVSILRLDYDGSAADGLASFDTADGSLRINAFHPFVAVFYDDFTGKSAAPLELVAMAEVLIESQLYAAGVRDSYADDFLTARDQLLRAFANDSGFQSAFAIGLALKEARNDPDKLEQTLCDAFRSLGFEVTRMGKRGRPDGVATALLAADKRGPRQYSVSLDAKSKVEDKGKVASGTVKVSTIARHRDDYKCQHAVVVGRDFPAARNSALAQEITRDREQSEKAGEKKTITLIKIDTLAKLVQLRPIKQVGLQKLRDLFDNSLSDDTDKWVAAIEHQEVPKIPYAKIVNTIEQLQKKFDKNPVKYAALLNELSHLIPPVKYDTEESLANICRGMAQMAPGQIFATSDSVELDQSAANVLATIEAATKKWAGEK